MAIKKILSLSLISSVLFASVNFKEAPKDFERVMPNGGSNVVLSYNQAIEEPQKSVVYISTEIVQKTNNAQIMSDPFFKFFFGDELGRVAPKDRVSNALGSGVIISEDGYIITNAHVVENATKIKVSVLNDTKEYNAKVIGSDKKTDIAVIKIDAKNLPVMSFADSSSVKVGDVVFAIGNPHGLAHTVTQGIVSALNKSGIGINEYENFIQTDASINPGNSGGALIDSRGALVGINSAIISKSGGSIGIGFAISSNLAKRISKTLIEKGNVKRGYLGVSIADVNQDSAKFYGENRGAVIVDLNEESDLYKKGIRRGDLVVAVNGKTIQSASELKNIVGSFDPSETIKIEYIRDKEKQSVDVKLMEYPDGEVTGGVLSMIEGLSYKNLDEKTRKAMNINPTSNGVIVTNVKDDTIAEKSGFKKGDIIVQVEKFTVTNVDDLNKILVKYKNIDKRFFVYRDGQIGMIVAK